MEGTIEMEKLFKQYKNISKRILKPVNWHDLRTLEPISRVFGFDRGTPIDRVYIEDFLSKNSKYIQGVVCEIAENSYSKKYGQNIKSYEILHYTNDNKNATIIGDLMNIQTLPQNKIDCFILTQTLNFIYDFKSAIQGLYYMLSTGGVGLVTVAGISQISRYDMDRWGDYWRFTDLSIKKAFEEVFGVGSVEVEVYGNVLTATAFLQGISAEELTIDELFHRDNDYQMTIAIKAIKK
jgi:ribosomal protein S17